VASLGILYLYLGNNPASRRDAPLPKPPKIVR
jgi:hypothetical protein